MTTPSSQPPSPFPSSPRTTISDGIDQNSIPKVRHGLDLFAHSRRGLDSFGLDWALSLAVKRARPDIVRYLLDETDGKVDGLSPFKVGIAARDPGIEVGKVEEVLKVLVERGWDVNGMEASGYVLFFCFAVRFWSLSNLSRERESKKLLRKSKFIHCCKKKSFFSF